MRVEIKVVGSKITANLRKLSLQHRNPYTGTDTITLSEVVNVTGTSPAKLYGRDLTQEEIEDVTDERVNKEYYVKGDTNNMSILVGLFMAVGGFLYGYDTGLINSITEMEYFKHQFAGINNEFTAHQMSIMVSSLLLGTFLGALGASLLADTYGRKFTVMFSTFFVFTIGNTVQVAATNIRSLITGRLISGVAVGLISVVVPLYQSEAAPKFYRGAIISTYQWAITWGLLLSSAVSQGTHARYDSSSYRIPIGLQYFWSFFLGIGMAFLPESPRYYVLKGQLDKAAKSLSFLRGVPEDDTGLLEELVEIKATYDYEMSLGTFTYLDCFRASKSRSKQPLRMITGILIQAFQQLSGINFIFYYGVNFFSRSGVSRSYLVSLVTYAVNVIFNIPGLLLVDYVGRRKLLIVGGALMAIFNFIIAIVGCSTNSVIANKVMIVFVCLFIASFAATWGGVVWVISAEMYPLGIRSKCTAICAATNWIVNFGCAFMTSYLIDTGSHTSALGTKIFFIWGSLNAAGAMIAYLAVYETSGLTLEEIEELYRLSPSSMASTAWNQRISVSPTQICISDGNNGKTFMNNKGISYSISQLQQPTSINDYANNTHRFTIDTLYPLPMDSATPQNYIDLGNGLGLATHTSIPPSLITENSDDDTAHNRIANMNERFGTSSENINTYISQLVDKYPPANGMNSAEKGQHNDSTRPPP